MGFRTGAYATVWEVKPVNDRVTSVRLNISRKNQQTDQYEQTFGGYVSFCGTAAAQKAARLQPRDRIRLGDVDVTNSYNQEKNVTYTNFTVFSFDDPNEVANMQNGGGQQTYGNYGGGQQGYGQPRQNPQNQSQYYQQPQYSYQQPGYVPVQTDPVDDELLPF